MFQRVKQKINCCATIQAYHGGMAGRRDGMPRVSCHELRSARGRIDCSSRATLGCVVLKLSSYWEVVAHLCQNRTAMSGCATQSLPAPAFSELPGEDDRVFVLSTRTIHWKANSKNG